MMFRILICSAVLMFVASTAAGEDKPKQADKLLEGMSIVGNDEAPKSLAIVPWKGSTLGETLSAFGVLDAGRQPVDKDVFMRELNYYQIREGASDVRTPARK